MLLSSLTPTECPHSLEYHLSAVAVGCCCCPFISVLFSSIGVTPLPDRVQGFAVHVPPHSSPLGEFCQTPSYRGALLVQGEPWACPWKARPSTQASFLQNLPFPHCLEGIFMGAVKDARPAVSISLVLPVVHTYSVCYSLLAAPFGLAPELQCLQCSDCLQRWQPLALCAWWLYCRLSTPE